MIKNDVIEKLFEENINPIIRYVNDIKENNFKARIADTYTSTCEDIITSYIKLLNFLNENLNIKLEKETGREIFNKDKVGEHIEIINSFIPSKELLLEKSDATLFDILLKNFSGEVHYLLHL